MDSNPFSTLEVDSITGYEKYILKMKELGMTAGAFTEHGCMLHNVGKKQFCEKNGIKLIQAEEFYVTESLDPENKVRDNYHCLLYAKNKAGVEELLELSSRAFEPDHFYYNPRISIDELIATSDNILVLTGCVAGILCRGTETIKQKFGDFLIKNKHRCWLEIQPHDFDKQKLYNKLLYQLSLQTGLKLIATSDIHALTEEQMVGRKIMQQSKLKTPFEDEDKCNLVLMDYDEMVEAFDVQNVLPRQVYLNALEETNNFAALIEDYSLDYTNKYPRSQNSEEEFKKRINNGILEHQINKLPNYKTEYLPRIKEEFETYKKNDAIDFMLLDSDYKNWMRDNGMHYGPSRGSVSGSIIAYLLHNTDVDSIKYELNFSRFMNPERASLADVDTDIYAQDRYKVREYFFGRDDLYCCNILTFNTIQMRGAIKDVARALGYTPDEAQKISNKVRDDDTLPEDVIREHEELYKYVQMVIGTITSVGRHAAGIVCSPIDLRKAFGTLHITSDPRPVSQVDMHEIDSLNFVKMDLLGLNAVGLIDGACKLAGIPYRTMDNTPLDDEKVIQSIAEDTTMIFQFESGFASTCLRRMLSPATLKKIREKNPNVSYLDLMSMVNGVIRPAGESFRDKMLSGEYRDNGNKALNDFLAPTLGYLTYQEQIIDFLHDFCGFTMGQADIVRRCVDENTLITMCDGNIKPIKDIKPGDKVISFSEIGCSNINVVNKVFDNGIQDCLCIKTKHGNLIECTGTHKLLTQNGYVEAANLTTDDYIMVPKRIVAETDGLRPNQRLSSDTMFMLGLLIGDGYLVINKPTYVNHEEALIEKYKECIRKLYRGDKECNFIVEWQQGITVERIYTVSIGTKEYNNSLNYLLEKYDLKHKANEKYIPDEFMKYPVNDKLINLIAGLFNADGGYFSNPLAIEYSSISVRLVKQLQQLLLKCNIYSSYYKKKVKGYGYYTHTLFINDPNALFMFKKIIIPYMIGEKRNDFIDIIDKKTKKKNIYNYLLPQKYIDEIKNNINAFGKSVRQIAQDAGYDLEIKNEFDSITDSKARYFSERVYCPETYKLLQADYFPVKITKIENIGQRHVYDLEVDNNHNYVANNIIVHNCFAKKTGTQDVIPIIHNGGYMTDIHGNKDDRYIKGFVTIAQEQYGMTKDEAENTITYFLQVISDASNYLFSKNHAVPYSAIGLFIGWLRYYYPLELFTAALNVYQSNQSKMSSIISYIQSKGFEIKSIKFGKSKAGYFMDKSENVIYQGIESIKGCNAKMADELYNLKDNHYDSFLDLLVDIKELTSVEKDQLETLIKLDFFSDFGDIHFLLGCYDIFAKYYGKKQIKKSLALEEEIDFDFLRTCCEKEAPKTFMGLDVMKLMRHLAENCEWTPTTLKQKMVYQLDILGFINIIDKKYKGVCLVTDTQTKYTPRIDLYPLANGNSFYVKIPKKSYKELYKGDLIKIDGKNCAKRPKSHLIDGKWVQDENDLEWWVYDYQIITGNEI
jgi:DNA polymerase III alpha subunit/intein/homing endonuclease